MNLDPEKLHSKLVEGLLNCVSAFDVAARSGDYENVFYVCSAMIAALQALVNGAEAVIQESAEAKKNAH